jgi:hypothetical protein
VLVLAFCALSTQVVAHSHGFSHSEDHCTCVVCHAVHAALPHPNSPATIQFTPKVTRFAAEEQPTCIIAAPKLDKIPRAPPA